MNLFSALGDTKAVLLEEDDENKNGQQAASNPAGTVYIYVCVSFSCPYMFKSQRGESLIVFLGCNTFNCNRDSNVSKECPGKQ